MKHIAERPVCSNILRKRRRRSCKGREVVNIAVLQFAIIPISIAIFSSIAKGIAIVVVCLVCGIAILLEVKYCNTQNIAIFHNTYYVADLPASSTHHKQSG